MSIDSYVMRALLQVADRAWNARFVWEMAATSTRVNTWGQGPSQITGCRFCGALGLDTLRHIVVCRHMTPRTVVLCYLNALQAGLETQTTELARLAGG